MGAEVLILRGVFEAVSKQLVRAGLESVTEKADAEDAKQKALQGDINAQLKVASYYARHKKYTESIPWYKMAADRGNLNAIACLGTFYVIGKGVPCDPVKGLAMIRRAAYAGNSVGQYVLGMYYYAGASGLPKNDRESQRWLSLAALQGDKDAKNNLAKYGLTLDRGATIPAYSPATMAPQNFSVPSVTSPPRSETTAPAVSPVFNNPNPTLVDKSAAANRACSNCGTNIPTAASFCPYCGAKQNVVKRVCPQCGAALLPEAKFCQICGTRFA